MNCIFCKVVAGEIPAKIVKEGDSYMAFKDINPQAPAHLLLIPKQHYSDLTEVKDITLLGSLLEAATTVASEQGLNKGFRVVINTGKESGQTVFHLHLHILGGRTMHWPPG